MQVDRKGTELVPNTTYQPALEFKQCCPRFNCWTESL